jgi:hypothetical protein
MFNGPVYDPAFDQERLTKQIGKVYDFMISGSWHTLSEISLAIGEPEASISAQLRHLRKERFGAYIVNRRPRGDRSHGLFEYQLLRPAPRLEPELQLQMMI